MFLFLLGQYLEVDIHRVVMYLVYKKLPDFPFLLTVYENFSCSNFVVVRVYMYLYVFFLT